MYHIIVNIDSFIVGHFIFQTTCWPVKGSTVRYFVTAGTITTVVGNKGQK